MIRSNETVSIPLNLQRIACEQRVQCFHETVVRANIVDVPLFSSLISRLNFLRIQRPPQVHGSLPRGIIGIFDQRLRIELFDNGFIDQIHQPLRGRFLGMRCSRDGRPEFLDHGPRVFRRQEERMVAQENVETSFDLIVIGFDRTVKQLYDSIDNHLIGEDVQAEYGEEITLRIATNLRTR